LPAPTPRASLSKLLKNQEVSRSRNLDFVSPDLVFVAPDFVFVAPDLAFVASDLDFGARGSILPQVLERADQDLPLA
jgi:hypothetical protein